ncbi:hypothetical protein GOBAR_AA29128 [Gossypium barbadense]|uniref:Uncharacterized protein n=1 Tax=Gossypium barbadense TaxID=3634 RepID=A0A2P5WKE0_GOSBA|nr:hypothetical protein GOBAR_AA29128 [Gossypium barbadense]
MARRPCGIAAARVRVFEWGRQRIVQVHARVPWACGCTRPCCTVVSDVVRFSHARVNLTAHPCSSPCPCGKPVFKSSVTRLDVED